MKILLIICLAFSISIGNLYSQRKTITGKVITEDLVISPYTSIVINDTVEIGKTDLNGYFQIEIPVSAKKILFRGLGMEAASMELGDNCKEMEVIMLSSSTYDFMSLRKVNRHRKRSFIKLPELRKAAFEKGIFKTAYACFEQQFITYNNKKQR